MAKKVVKSRPELKNKTKVTPGAMPKNKRGQSALEYLTTYGWAILIIAIVLAILYLYLAVPTQIVNNTCSFVSGAYCNDMIIGTNTLTHKTTVAFYLTNSQQYPLKNPKLYARVNNQNSTAYRCSPNFVLPGGSILCTLNLTTNTTLDALLSGNLYMNATYCGLSVASYSSKQNCSTGIPQTYSGTFVGHTQPLVSTKSSLTLNAVNYTQTANNNLDPLSASVSLLGYPLKGATVNFTENNIVYPLAPNLTTTNPSGIALSAIAGTVPGSVKVTATYAGLTSNVIINFIAPAIVTFVPQNFTYCSSSGTTAVIDGTPYTCSQLAAKQFAFTKGTTHTYSFYSSIPILSSIREHFKNIVVKGIPYTANSGNIVASSNLTVPFFYYAQYYFSENAIPITGGTLFPGSNWYNSSSTVSISETQNSPYFFNTWTCSGTGCYAGTQTSVIIQVNNPINESANFYSTSTSTTSSSSTSTSSLSTSSTSSLSTTSSSTSSTSLASTSTSTSTTSTSTSTSTSRTTTSIATTSTSTSTSTTSPTTAPTTTSTTTSSSTTTTTIKYYDIYFTVSGDSCDYGSQPGTTGPCGDSGPTSIGAGCYIVSNDTYADAYAGSFWAVWACPAGTNVNIVDSGPGTGECGTQETYQDFFLGLSSSACTTGNSCSISSAGSNPPDFIESTVSITNLNSNSFNQAGGGVQSNWEQLYCG